MITDRIVGLSAIAFLTAGCGMVADVHSDAGDEAPQAMFDACPPMAIAGKPPQPCAVGLVCEYNYGSTLPLCQGAQACLADGGWQDTRNALACPSQAQCPALPPAGPCNTKALPAVEICSYPDAGVDCVCATCAGGKPSVAWRCFSPTPTCAKRPELGTACSDPTARCEYPPACCGAFVQKCERGVWLQEPQPGCPI